MSAASTGPLPRSQPARARAAPRIEHILPYDDPERLGELLRGLEPRMRAVALRVTRDGEAARDVVQAAYEKALRHGRKFRGGARVSTWLHRIVTNEALMWLRRERRHHNDLPRQHALDPLVDTRGQPFDRAAADLIVQSCYSQRCDDGSSLP